MENNKPSKIQNRLIPFLFAAAGVFCICLGLSRGEAFQVLQKAIHICLECVGIG